MPHMNIFLLSRYFRFQIDELPFLLIYVWLLIFGAFLTVRAIADLSAKVIYSIVFRVLDQSDTFV